MPRQFNPYLVKTHRIYDVSEVAVLLNCNRQTVIRWIKDKGLAAEIRRKPWLIRGSDLRNFLGARRQERKVKLALHDCYCLGCKCARTPDGKIADYQQTSPTSGRYTGLCPACGTVMHKHIRRDDLQAIRAKVDVTIQGAVATLVDASPPHLKVNSSKEHQSNGKEHRR